MAKPKIVTIWPFKGWEFLVYLENSRGVMINAKSKRFSEVPRYQIALQKSAAFTQQTEAVTEHNGRKPQFRQPQKLDEESLLTLLTQKQI